MDDRFVTDDLDPGRKSLLPGAGFFVPDDVEEDLREERTAAAVDGAEAAVVADPDADGLACVALIREAYDDVRDLPEPQPEAVDSEPEASDDPSTGGAADDAAGDADPIDVPEPTPHRVALVPASPHDVEEAIERVATHAGPGIDLYVCDLAPDRYEYVADELEAAAEVASAIRWYDHHQWDDAVAASVREAGAELVVGDSETECSADVTVRSLGYDFGPTFEELAAVTRDHDLWLREDPRSDDLADYAYWADPAEYVEVVREHGADLPDWVADFLSERRIEKDALIDQAVGRAEYREVGPYTVGVTYGRCSQNEVAEAMREQGADASAIVKPAGSASIRGTEAFQRCHEVAGLVSGGGHPKAAGCKPDIYDDMLDYATHWTTRGAVTKRVILRAFETVVEAEADEAEADEAAEVGETAEDGEGVGSSEP